MDTVLWDLRNCERDFWVLLWLLRERDFGSRGGLKCTTSERKYGYFWFWHIQISRIILIPVHWSWQNSLDDFFVVDGDVVEQNRARIQECWRTHGLHFAWWDFLRLRVPAKWVYWSLFFVFCFCSSSVILNLVSVKKIRKKLTQQQPSCSWLSVHPSFRKSLCESDRISACWQTELETMLTTKKPMSIQKTTPTSSHGWCALDRFH